MSRIGKYNALTDVAGLLVGHVSAFEAASGATVILCPEGAVGGVDVRGSAPGTRETDMLQPTNLVEKIQAVILSGGSTYGLAAADGAVRWLAEKGWGFPLGQGQVAPLVCGAVIYDLGRGRDFVPPTGPEWGRQACEKAAGGLVAQGCVGAGTGAVSGGLKGGVGSASEVLDGAVSVAALVVVNSLGSAVDPVSGRLWESRVELAGEFGPAASRAVKLPRPESSGPARHTTIGVVATDSSLSKAQAQKVAQMAHDGLARAIRPAHTMFDGDTIFCLATGRKDLPAADGFFEAPQAQALSEVGRAAADCFVRAIIHALLAAESAYGFPAFRDLPSL